MKVVSYAFGQLDVKAEMIVLGLWIVYNYNEYK